MSNARCLLTSIGRLKIALHIKDARFIRTKSLVPNSRKVPSAARDALTKTSPDLQVKYRRDVPEEILKSIVNDSLSKCLTQRDVFTALKALSGSKKPDDISRVVDVWLKDVSLIRLDEDFSAILRYFSIRNAMHIVERITDRIGFVIPDDVESKVSIEFEPEQREVLQQMMCDLSFGYANAGQVTKCVHCLSVLREHEMVMKLETALKILKMVIAHGDSQAIRKCLGLLVQLSDGLNHRDANLLIPQQFGKTIEFVTGAVSMATLPIPDCPEVAFIGRSNVGKSSLINMITNEKELARTSRKPGKTAEFNYYDVSSEVGPHKERHRFYLVDVPGVGYALKSRALRSNWTNLLRSYVSERTTLRVLFHLVDSRHGLLEADRECLDLLTTLPKHVQYVIVLTKADKLRSCEETAAVQEVVIDKIYEEVGKRTDRVVPLLFTSAERKQGSAALWSTILDGVNRGLRYLRV